MWELNQSIFLFFYSLAHIHPMLDWVVVIVAEILPYLLGIAVVLHAFRSHHLKKGLTEIIWIAFPVFSAFLFSVAIKAITEIPRPFVYARDVTPLVSVSDPFGSFPSSHAIVFSSLGFALYLHDRRIGVIFACCALLIGLARIVAGVHWPLDIFFGILFGQLFAIIWHGIEQKFGVSKTW